MRARGYFIIAIIDIRYPVTDLFAPVQRLANQSFVVVLPRGRLAAGFISPRRLGRNIFWIGLRGIETAEPPDQGIPQEVAPIISMAGPIG